MDNHTENENFFKFLVSTALLVFIFQSMFGLIFQNFIFTIKLEGLTPTLNKVTNNSEYTIYFVLFAILFLPCFGAEITLRLGRKSSFNHERVFSESRSVGLITFGIGFVLLSPISMIFIITSFGSYPIVFLNNIAFLLHEITGILIKTISLVIITNLTTGMFIWPLYLHLFKFRIN